MRIIIGIVVCLFLIVGCNKPTPSRAIDKPAIKKDTSFVMRIRGYDRDIHWVTNTNNTYCEYDTTPSRVLLPDFREVRYITCIRRREDWWFLVKGDRGPFYYDTITKAFFYKDKLVWFERDSRLDSSYFNMETVDTIGCIIHY